MIDFSNKRIMFLATTDNMIWQFLIPHIIDLQDMGATVDCFCAKTGFWFDQLKEKFHFNMYDISLTRSPFNFKNIKGYNDLKKYQRNNKYDIIYCQQPVGAMMGRLIGKKFHIPVIYTAHGFFFFKHNNPIKNFIFKSAEKFLSRYTDVLITMAKEDFDAIKKWKVKYKYLIHGIGFNHKKYLPSSKTIDELKEEFNIDVNDHVIVTVAELIKRKNYPTMLKAFARIHKELPNTKYVICGTGVLLKKMKNLAKNLKIDNSVIFLGYRIDINKILQLSDVMLLLSKHEGLTMAIMEGMYYSLPIVVSNVRGNRDLIDDNLGGKLIDFKDDKSASEAIIELLKNPDLRKKMGSYNHEKVKKYDIEVVRDELKRIYNEVEL